MGRNNWSHNKRQLPGPLCQSLTACVLLMAGAIAVAPAHAAEGLECTFGYNEADENVLLQFTGPLNALSRAQRDRVFSSVARIIATRVEACGEARGWSDQAKLLAFQYRIWRLQRQRMHSFLPYLTEGRRTMESQWSDADLAPMFAMVSRQNDNREQWSFDPDDAQLQQAMPDRVVIAAMRRGGLGRHAAAAAMVRLELYASLMAEDFAARFAAAE
jgi:hypothetical protein